MMVAFARHPLHSKPLLYAIATARFEASRFVRLGALPEGEQEDAAQDILVAVLQRWPGYSSDRGAPATFLSIVARRSAASLARARTAKKRGGGRRCMSISDCAIEAADAEASFATASVDVRSDVQSVVAILPPRLQEACLLLTQHPPTEAARRLGISYATFRKLLSAIRTYFEAAGLGPDR